MAWKTALRVDILAGQTMYFEWAKPVATELQCGLRENDKSVDDGWSGLSIPMRKGIVYTQLPRAELPF